MAVSRYVVGIDLGTTNSALAYVDTSLGDEARIVTLPIPQVVAPGEVADRPLLPSFLYLPGPGEQPAGALRLPWAPERDFAVGEFARQFGTQVPTRLVSSAKCGCAIPESIAGRRSCRGRRRTRPPRLATRKPHGCY